MISIITPTYNSSKFIYRLHDSLAKQSDKDFEWIVVDDYSNDETIKILTKLTPPGLGGMRVYKMPFNSGGGIAASVGVIKSIGNITTIIDQDDELDSNAIFNIKNYFINTFKKKEVAVVLFPSVQPNSGKQISSLYPGVLFKISYFVYKEKESVDGVMAMKGDLARYYYTLPDCARTLLSSVIWLRISKKYFFEYAGGDPVLIYHRDNNKSHSNRIRVSSHLIFSFARILDYHDKYYYLQPIKWLRYTLALYHFSISYYGSPIPIFKLISRWSTKVWCSLLLPFGIIAHFLKPKYEIIKYKNMDPNVCAEISKEVRNETYKIT